MILPEPIDLETWTRRETFEYYRERVPCTYAITVEIDVTQLLAALRRTGRKTYLAQIWAIANVVNRRREFRMALTEDGAPATWPVVHPAFTVFNAERETFAVVWSQYDMDFVTFHERTAEVVADAASATTMFPRGELPPDVFDVSSVPWTHFTGFSLQIDGGTRHLLPIFTIGRHVERGGRTFMPLAVQVHHASADGFHTARLVNDIRELMAIPEWVERSALRPYRSSRS
ncbi:Chloramphenicol acetyltransferase 2 [Microbacterium oleivorans]|uniref:CatA-like O-acetyltransferase n=1 Tax=Microbacterium oleivorans TaxID=273677 RepID=UPI000978D07E|nr:CatA-like O-acetyltransferase [Microbacterium oleivorans]AZS43713.1 Chloramphenicol acetyltransferase 2 [Microbacterium oleivorans]